MPDEKSKFLYCDICGAEYPVSGGYSEGEACAACEENPDAEEIGHLN